MTEGRHYRVDFVTFSRILGFREEEQGFTYIHDEARAEIRDIAICGLIGEVQMERSVS